MKNTFLPFEKGGAWGGGELGPVDEQFKISRKIARYRKAMGDAVQFLSYIA